ncbi:3-oxoadipate enol-lactonase [Chitinophagaceae bacterium LB-8]|uniref:3-oxoadipate enol-lactonase n=1 Tax=Paraflavisolibacter caeni TaxID=2982496 RepID=A0A9X2XP31_9BACT|nr:3-oxoadipate enol-lactonase [Paraflavisolibacter caeni]MCU7549779.1 3-oxoadipate enol-lactonase [Paraflavisolibacter caeni]
MQFININGKAIHYKYLKGNGERTFLFVNSLGTDFRIWDRVVELIRSEGSVLCFDKPGHGLSEEVDGPIRISDYVQLIISLLDMLQIEKCVYVGLSIGGLIGQHMALKHSERIEHLILSNSAPKADAAEYWKTRINAIRQGGMASLSDKILERWLSEDFRNNQKIETAGLKRMLESCSTLGYIHACEAIRDEDLSNEIHAIAIPTLCIAGSEDNATPQERVEATAAKIPNAKMVVINGVGHLPCVETPQEFVQILLDFLASSNGSLNERGMKTRRAVLGNAHVDRAEAHKTSFDQDFQEYITNNAWGAVWARPGLTKRERSLLTIALLTAMRYEDELAMHIRATQNTGASEEDVKEVLLHTAVYAGVPATNGAIKIAKEIFNQKNASHGK